MMLYMVFDVESVGLHGEGFAVGWVVVDENNVVHAAACYACEPETADGLPEDRDWIAENVPVPHVGYNCRDPQHVRDEFWRAFMYAKNRGATIVSDCPWPVEANFLEACIGDDPSRKFDGPYPLIDVASVRLTRGLDSLGTEHRLPQELPKHNPMADARQSARLLIEALYPLNGLFPPATSDDPAPARTAKEQQ